MASDLRQRTATQNCRRRCWRRSRPRPVHSTNFRQYGTPQEMITGRVLIKNRVVVQENQAAPLPLTLKIQTVEIERRVLPTPRPGCVRLKAVEPGGS